MNERNAERGTARGSLDSLFGVARAARHAHAQRRPDALACPAGPAPADQPKRASVPASKSPSTPCANPRTAIVRGPRTGTPLGFPGRARGRSSVHGLASKPLGGSSNGRTQDSGSCYLGSNPSPPAHFSSDRSFRPHRLAVRTSASHAGNAGSIPAGVAKHIQHVRVLDRIPGSGASESGSAGDAGTALFGDKDARGDRSREFPHVFGAEVPLGRR